jgi:ABC-2 type transport system permease protein
VLPLGALLAISAAVVAGATSGSGSGIDKTKLDRSLATAFGHLYRMQTGELHRPAVTEAQLRTGASCDKGGSLVADIGPGNDWRCVVTWRLPGSTAVGSAVYQLDVSPDGRYVADGDGPQEVNGFFQVHTMTGDAPNPLWQFDGLVDLLASASNS